MALIMQRRRGGEVGHITVGMQEAVTFTTLQTASGNWWTLARHLAQPPHPRSAPASPSRPETVTGSHSRSIRRTGTDSSTGSTTSLDSRKANWRGEDWDDEFWREQHQPEIIPWIDRLCKALTVTELHDKGQELGLLVLPINTVEEVANDPHLIARGYYQSVDHPQLATSLILPRSPIRTRGEQPRAQTSPSIGRTQRKVSACPRLYFLAPPSGGRCRGATEGGSLASPKLNPLQRITPSTQTPPRRRSSPRLHLGHRRIARHPTPRRPRRRSPQDRVRVTHRPDPLSRRPAARPFLNQHQRHIQRLRRRQEVSHPQPQDRGRHRSRPRAGPAGRPRHFQLHPLPARPLGYRLRRPPPDQARHHRLQRRRDGYRRPAGRVALIRQRDRRHVRARAPFRDSPANPRSAWAPCTPTSPSRTTSQHRSWPPSTTASAPERVATWRSPSTRPPSSCSTPN